jgi:hypothetical protein
VRSSGLTWGAWDSARQAATFPAVSSAPTSPQPHHIAALFFGRRARQRRGVAGTSASAAWPAASRASLALGALGAHGPCCRGVRGLVSGNFGCFPRPLGAFPSSSLASVANLALLSHHHQSRLVPCPNAARHQPEPAHPGTPVRASAVLHVQQPAASPRPSSCRRVRKSLRSTSAHPLRSTHPALLRESPARITEGPRSSTAWDAASVEQLSPHPSSRSPALTVAYLARKIGRTSG